MTTTSQQSKAAQAVPRTEFFDLSQLAPRLLFKVSSAYLRSLLNLRKEMKAFLSDRMLKDATLEEALTNGESIIELIKAQQGWALTAMKDYMNESVKLLSLANQDLIKRRKVGDVRQAAE